MAMRGARCGDWRRADAAGELGMDCFAALATTPTRGGVIEGDVVR